MCVTFESFFSPFVSHMIYIYHFMYPSFLNNLILAFTLPSHFASLSPYLDHNLHPHIQICIIV